MFIDIFILSTFLSAPDTTRLSLDEAIAMLRERNPMVAAVRAEARAAGAMPGLASRGILPTLSLGATAMRSTDPVAAFGMKLRQENFQATDLALDPLNRPDPYGGYSLYANLEQPLFAPEGIFGYRAAASAARAQEAASRRATGTMVDQTIRIYWGVQLAGRMVETLEAAHSAALAHADQAESLREQGMTTGLDARLARVRAAEVEAQLIAARANEDNALSALRSMLDLPDSLQLQLTDELRIPDTPTCGMLDCTAGRADVEAAQAAAEAARLNVRRAWASNLPALVAFANVASYGHSSPFSGTSGDWTVGVAIVWKPFSGMAGIAAVDEARALHDQRTEQFQAITRQAELERLQGHRNLDAAGQRLMVAQAAATEAAEALSQAELRYRTGVSTITELLDVQAATNAAELNLSAAVHDVLVSQSALDFAYGVFDE